MKSLSRLVSAIFVVVLGLSACNKSGSTTSSDGASTDAVVQTAVVAQPVSNDGVYLFDEEAYRAHLKAMNDPMMKDIPAEAVEGMMAVFKSYTITIKGEEATATFGDMSVKGSLKDVSLNGETRLFMTPVDEDKKTQTVTLVIKDGKLVLDPGKTDADKMQFKKTS